MAEAKRYIVTQDRSRRRASEMYSVYDTARHEYVINAHHIAKGAAEKIAKKMNEANKK